MNWSSAAFECPKCGQIVIVTDRGKPTGNRCGCPEKKR